jgi:hypothetical protein
MKRIFWSLLLLPSIAFAQNDTEIRYTWVGVAFGDAEFDVPGENLDAGGWNVDVSFAVRDHIHLFGSYQTFELDDFADANVSEKTFGIGTHFEVLPNLSLFGRLGAIDVSADDGTASADDDGYRAIAGVRYMPWGGFEFRAGVDYVDLDVSGNDTGGFVGGDIWLTDSFSLTGDVQFRDDATAFLFGARIYFGN